METELPNEKIERTAAEAHCEREMRGDRRREVGSGGKRRREEEGSGKRRRRTANE